MVHDEGAREDGDAEDDEGEDGEGANLDTLKILVIRRPDDGVVNAWAGGRGGSGERDLFHLLC